MLRVIGVHAAQEAQVIGDGGEMRHQIGDHHAALAAWAHRCHGLECEELVGANLGDFLAQGRVNLLPVFAGDEVFRVEEIHLRGTTLHEEEDDALGPWHHAGEAGRNRIRSRAGDVVQGECTESAGGALEELAAGERFHGDKKIDDRKIREGG